MPYPPQSLGWLRPFALSTSLALALRAVVACQWPLAVSEASQQTKLTIFPNPSTSHFYIQSGVDFATDTKFHLVNAIGQDITSQCTFRKEAPNRYYLSTTRLTPGTYFVQVVSQTGATTTKKVTIQ